MSVIEKKSDEIIMQAVLKNASDVHIIPFQTYAIVQIRIGGQLTEIEKIKSCQAEKLISHFKFRGKMDIGERRRPQNGSLNVIANNQRINLRISTLPTTPHESMAIRLLPQNEIYSIKRLSLYEKQANELHGLMNKAHGLLLISGPTGCGKTTTIYSLLFAEAMKERRIISIEDPIEKRLSNFIQVEINEKSGITYESALKASLRHDPDIIMIGEIRDRATAKIAVRAAMTGHLVVSTIHASTSETCVSRLREFGIPSLDMEEAIVGLVSQRLVKLRCFQCEASMNVCSSNCQHNQRLAIYEILAGTPLKKILEGKRDEANYKRLAQLIGKSIALGYLNEQEYERWLC